MNYTNTDDKYRLVAGLHSSLANLGVRKPLLESRGCSGLHVWSSGRLGARVVPYISVFVSWAAVITLL